MDSAHLMGTAYDLSRVGGNGFIREEWQCLWHVVDDEPIETDKFVNRATFGKISEV